MMSGVIPLPVLSSRTGLHVDVVTQLGEMQAYIAQVGGWLLLLYHCSHILCSVLFCSRH
jgi:hypothetical protein